MVQFLHFVGEDGLYKGIAFRSCLIICFKKEKEKDIRSTYLYLATSNSEGGI